MLGYDSKYGLIVDACDLAADGYKAKVAYDLANQSGDWIRAIPALAGVFVYEGLAYVEGNDAAERKGKEFSPKYAELPLRNIWTRLTEKGYRRFRQFAGEDSEP